MTFCLLFFCGAGQVYPNICSDGALQHKRIKYWLDNFAWPCSSTLVLSLRKGKQLPVIDWELYRAEILLPGSCRQLQPSLAEAAGLYATIKSKSYQELREHD